MNSKHPFFIIISLLFIVIFTTPALAHKIRIFAWEEGGQIITETKFSGGRTAKGATVTVYDADSKVKLLSGITDEKGLFSFPLPGTKATQLEIEVNSGDGHKNSWLYTKNDQETTIDSEEVSVSPQIQDSSNDSEAQILLPQTEKCMAQADIEQIITTAIDNQLAPIRKQLAENSEQGPTFRDILGGIGYLLGIAGIIAYMKSKQINKE